MFKKARIYSKTSLNPRIKTSEKLALEPRIVFDGAGVATAAADISLGPQNTEPQADAALENAIFLLDDTNIAEQAGLTNHQYTDNKEIAFIDMRLNDAQTLIDNMRDDVTVILIDPTKDGLGQINNALADYTDVEAIHLYTHGDENGFTLGNTIITAQSLSQNADGFTAIGQKLSANADILLYGCDLAQTATGQSMLSQIASLTSADISASANLTGASDLGGDWTLEYNTGDIEAGLSITSAGQASFSGILAADPEATVTAPANDPLIGEQVTFTVTFDNIDVDTGFGPYVNLFMPFLGADGVYNPATNTYSSTADGLEFVSASYLGTTVNSTIITLEDIDTGTGGLQFEHPIAKNTAGDPLVITLDAGLGLREGDQLVILELPFGSFTPGQPAADIEITANVSANADVGTGLDVITDAGFIFGETAIEDNATDPSIQAATLTTGNTNRVTITPQLFRINTILNAPEGETATGPNFERSYDIEIEVANGQTITDVDIAFTASESFVITSTAAAGATISNPSQSIGGDLSDDVVNFNFANVTGTQTATVNFYVSEFDQNGINVLDPVTGASSGLGETNNVSITYDWNPSDVRDGDVADANVTETAAQITAKSIATQKSVSIQNDTNASGATPGDTLLYTINFQISDFFAFDITAVVDTFSDGQNFDTGFTPTLTITNQGTPLAQQTFTLGLDYSLTENTSSDYSETLAFDLSAFVPSILEGGKFDTDDLGGTSGTITFRTIIQDTYANPALGSSNFIKQADTLDNTVSIVGRNLDTGLTPFAGPQLVVDNSGASVTVPSNAVSLDIFALNGSTSGTLTDIKPGDDVTFRLQYDLITGDLENFFLDAYLPLPVFNLNDINADGSTGENFVLDNGSPIPTVGDFRYGPTATADITSGIPSPTPATDITSNFIRFNFGDLSDTANDGGKIDLLFTIRATNDPFADGLLLSTLSQQSDDNTANITGFSNDLGQITLQQPEINEIIKGVVATNNLFSATFDSGTPSGIKAAGNTDANPLNTIITSSNLNSLNLDNDLSGVDDGDIVRYAIVIENTGSSPNGAFDLTIRDIIPSGMEIPSGGLNLRVVDGTGATVGIDTASPETALFAGGITLTDNGATGAIGGANGTPGENIIIITYDLVISDASEAAATLTSQATLSNFANTEGGPDFTASDLTDAATVTIDSADLSKILTFTNQSHTSGNNVTVGEVVSYTLTVTVPEGQSTSAVLVDTLDAGLAFVSIDSIVIDSADITSTAGTGAAILASNVTISNVGASPDNAGRVATINFGTLTNANTDNSIDETITITYSAIVVNSAASDGGDSLNNSANWTTTDDNVTVSGATVMVVEPQVDVTITPNITDADTGDTITWTVTLTAPAGNDADAFDITYANLIPSGLTYIPGSAQFVSGIPPDAPLTENGGNFTAGFAQFTPGQTATFTYQTTIDTGAAIESTLNPTGTARWHSTSGAQADLSPFTTVDTERTGAGGINDLVDTGTGAISILTPQPTLELDTTSEIATPLNDVVPGEIARYRFTMRIPESTTDDFSVEIDIPDGLQYLNDGSTAIAFLSDGGLSANAAGLAGNAIINSDGTDFASVEPVFTLPAGLISGGAFVEGTNPVFNLGTVANLDNDLGAEFIIIEFNALVLNSANAQGGDTLTATAAVFGDDGSGITELTSTSPVDIDVIEPALSNLQKTVISSTGTQATFQITFENTSGVDAFNANIFEDISGLINLDNIGNISVQTENGASAVVNNSTSDTLDIDIGNMPFGASVTITYTANVIDNTLAVPSSDIDLTWTSINGDRATLGVSSAGIAGTLTGERDGSGGINDFTLSSGAGLGSLSGRLFVDNDMSNTINAGDTFPAGVQINLTGAGADGIFGTQDDFTATTLTDTNGNYAFGALPAGDVRLSVQPTGLPNGINAQLNPFFDSQGAPTDNLIELTLSDGGTSTGNLFGVYDIPEPPAGADKTIISPIGISTGFNPADFGFSDPDIDAFLDNVRIDTIPAAGTFQLNGIDITPGQIIAVSDIPNLAFTPTPDQAGTDVNFTFSVQDERGLFDPVPNTMTIFIEDVAFEIPAEPLPNIPEAPPPINDIPVSTPELSNQIFISSTLNNLGIFSLSEINFQNDPSHIDFWIAGAVEQKLMIELKEMSFQVSKAIFRHSNPGEPLTFEAEQLDGSPLPDWLNFDAGSLTFKGVPPINAPENLDLAVIATDTRGEEIKAPVRVIINREEQGGTLTTPESIQQNGDNKPLPEGDQNMRIDAAPEQSEPENKDQKDQKQGYLAPENRSPEGRPSFSEQLEAETRFAKIQKHRDFIESISS